MRGGICQAQKFFPGALLFLRYGARLLRGDVHRPRQLFAPRGQCPQCELRFLRLAVKCALLLARLIQFAFDFNHPVVKLCMPLLAVGQLHVKFFKAAFSLDFALFQLTQLRFNLTHVELDLLAARTGLLGQLGEAQHFNLQFMCAALADRGLTAGSGQTLGCIQVHGLSPHRRALCFIADQDLCLELFVEIFNLLRTAQQASLFRIWRIKADAVQRNGMTAFDDNRFACLQLVTCSQSIIKAASRVATVQPVAKQCRLTSIIQAQQISQRF